MVVLSDFIRTSLIYALQFGTLGAGIALILSQFKEKDDLQELFKASKLVADKKYPLLVENKEKSYGYDLKFSLPPGLSLQDFLQRQERIEQYLNAKVKIIYTNKLIIIQVYQKQLQKSYDFETVITHEPVELVVGHSLKGIETIDISTEGPHLLIAGESGSGKSTVLRAILTNLVLTKRPSELALHLIDLKYGAEFNVFSKSRLVKSFSRSKAEAEEVLYQLSAEVERRYNLFYDSDVVDIKEYNKKFYRNKLCYEIVVIDEFADMQNEQESIKILEELSAKARACGIHLILSTQRPDAKVLNGRIKANVPAVIGLKTMNEINSRVIIDRQGLEKLRGKGHGILKRNGIEVEIQAMNISPEQTRDLIKHTYENKKKKITKDNTTGEVIDFNFLKDLR